MWGGNGLRFQRKLQATLAAMLAFSLLIAALSYQNSSQSVRLLERSRLAHEILQEYLDILSTTYELYTIVGLEVAALDGDVPVALSAEEELLKRLERQSGMLRRLSAEELIVLYEQGRQPEQEESDRLIYIDQRITSLVRRYRDLLEDQGSRVDAAKLRERFELLDSGFGTEFRAQIKSGIAYEQSQVAQTDQTVRYLIESGRRQMIAIALAALLFCLVSAIWLSIAVRRAFKRLQTGTDEIAAGRLSHRIEVVSRDEFADLASRINGMAAELESRRSAAVANQAALERTVDERTRSLNELNLGLVEAEHSRRRFLADISHELRTPLTIIRGECDVALRTPGTDPIMYRKCLQIILDQSKQTADLVDDLLFIARKEAGEIRLKVQEVDIGQVVSQIAGEVRTLCEGKQLQLQYDQIGRSETVFVAGDPRRLRQLFLVLLDNAIKYSPADTRIQLSLAITDTEATIVVADEGVGIPEFELPHVFDRYYRGGSKEGSYSEGVGLGLPVAKAIAEAHDGQIEIKSGADSGTSVSVTLPLAARMSGRLAINQRGAR